MSSKFNVEPDNKDNVQCPTLFSIYYSYKTGTFCGTVNVDSDVIHIDIYSGIHHSQKYWILAKIDAAVHWNHLKVYVCFR